MYPTQFFEKLSSHKKGLELCSAEKFSPQISYDFQNGSTEPKEVLLLPKWKLRSKTCGGLGLNLEDSIGKRETNERLLFHIS